MLNASKITPIQGFNGDSQLNPHFAEKFLASRTAVVTNPSLGCKVLSVNLKKNFLNLQKKNSRKEDMFEQVRTILINLQISAGVFCQFTHREIFYESY